MILALFLIETVLIITAALSGYLIGRLYEKQLPEKKIYFMPSTGEEKELPVRRTPTMTPIKDDVKIDYPPQESSPISSIKPPTKEQIERKNMPKKYQESEEEMEKTLDELFESGEDWQ